MQAAACEGGELRADIPVMATLDGQSRLVHVPSIIRGRVAGILSYPYEYQHTYTNIIAWCHNGIAARSHCASAPSTVCGFLRALEITAHRRNSESGYEPILGDASLRQKWQCFLVMRTNKQIPWPQQTVPSDPHAYRH